MRAQWMANVGLTAAVALAGGGLLVGYQKPAAPTWAQMAESFKAEKFVAATICFKSDAEAPREEAELWVTNNWRARLRTGSTIVLAKGGEAPQAFDLKTRQPADASAAAAECVTRATSKPRLVLDAVLGAITGGCKMDEMTQLGPPDVCVADVADFVMQSQTSPEVIHVWMDLRSKLPTKMRLSNPRTGGWVEALFSYPKQMHASFFDPAVAGENIVRVVTNR